MSSLVWVLVPITALMIPIVTIFVLHQQKMAQIIHGRHDPSEVDALRDEVRALTAKVDALTAVLGSGASVAPEVAKLQDRIGG